jgi:hypothetical protein
MSGVKHAFTNPKSDGTDATVTRPSDWNADHATAETDITKVASPDGSGGITFRPEKGSATSSAAGLITAYNLFR